MPVSPTVKSVVRFRFARALAFFGYGLMVPGIALCLLAYALDERVANEEDEP